ncbi:MAG: aminopeptidase P N-terminal domain-containing protein, partial [Chitinophagaceae bacterium]
MFDKETYIKRRKRLKEDVGHGLILLLGNAESSMNYLDNTYHFRQDSNFLYFFGMDRPGLMAMIDVDNDTEFIFGDDISVEDIIWTGPLQSLRDYAEQAGVSKTSPSVSISDI